MRTPSSRFRRLRGGAALVALAGLTIGAPVAALGATTTPVQNIKIIGSPTLHVNTKPGPNGYHYSWVLFRTNVHLHEPRQIIVRLSKVSGRSFGLGGVTSTCVRSAIVHTDRALKPGAKYRAQFYVRASVGATTRQLLLTRTLVARGVSRAPVC